jgi:hypothetical protein
MTVRPGLLDRGREMPLTERDGTIAWPGFWLGVAIVLGIIAITSAIAYGCVQVSNNHRKNIVTCLNHNRPPLECRSINSHYNS